MVADEIWTQSNDSAEARFYVMRSTSDGVSQAFKADADGYCAWNELATPDLKGALRFYPQQFGWSLGESMPMGDMGNYQMFELTGQPIGGMMTAGPGGSPPMWRFYIPCSEARNGLAKDRARRRQAHPRSAGSSGRRRDHHSNRPAGCDFLRSLLGARRAE